MRTGMEAKLKQLPKYTRSFGELKRTAVVGDLVTLKRRVLDFKKGGWALQELDCHVVEIAPNCLIVRERQTGIPWYAIHDWEIVKT